MMERRDFLAAAALLPAVGNTATPTLREQVLGAWRIRDADTVNAATGATRPWLDRPKPYAGMIVYLPSGVMSVQIGSARPPSTGSRDFNGADGKTCYADSWYAYYGRFEIDEAKSIVRHVIEGSLFPFETGQTYERKVQLEAGLLTLRTVNFDDGPDGKTFNRLTWIRIPG